MFKLRYIERGSGPVVFFLHAFPLDRTMWASQVEAIHDRFRAITPDLPGFGESAPGPEGWRLRDVATATLEIADSLGISSFRVVGLSMGGYAALEICRAAPERVAALVLANSKARADTPEERDGRRKLAEAVKREGVHLLEQSILPRLLREDPDPPVVASVRATIGRAEPGAVAQALEALGERADSTSLLARIQSRALVIASTEDSISPVSECQRMAAGLPHGQLVEIPGAGHLSNLENPASFNQALSTFLESL